MKITEFEYLKAEQVLCTYCKYEHHENRSNLCNEKVCNDCYVAYGYEKEESKDESFYKDLFLDN